LLFLFWRVLVPCWGGAPHTPNLAFSFTCKHDDLLVLKHPA
jgi:hypothetical protein